MNVRAIRDALGTGSLVLLLGVGLAAQGPAVAQMQYNEAPMLAERVEAGELPPVEERLPREPLVQEVVEAIGTYGGTLRRGFLGPSDHNNYTRVVYDALVRHAPDGSEVIPHIAKGWESNDDFSQWTVFLREGMKWSDGEPFTADDIMFWYESILLNEDLSPSAPLWMHNADGSTASVEKLDETTVRWTFAQPNTAFLLDLANMDGADRSITNLAFAPAHYLKDFHPEFTDDGELQEKVRERGFQTWVELFAVEALPHTSGRRPGTAAWVPDGTTVADEVFVIKRNPYYFAVDPEGNQLPYIDEVQFRFFADQQALNFAAVAGELDFQARHIQMTNYPVLVENGPRSGYRVITWPTFGGSDAAVWINQQYLIDPELGELLANRDFRIALSIGINRDEIRESAFLGLGEIRQPVPAPWHPYYPGDESAFRYTELDVEEANRILDGLGLTRGPDGNRRLPSGAPLRLEISVVPAFGPWTDVAQLVAADWQALGLTTDVQVRERTAHFTMRDSNELMIEIWNDDTTAFPFTGNPKVDPRSQPATIFAVESRTLYRSDGERGIEPTGGIKRIVDIIEEAKTVGVEQQIALAQELFTLTSNELYGIGTVGLTPMIQGVVVVNEDLKNVPLVVANDWPLRTPGDARPEQFFFDR
jgi:peptide/nickel transport system substrate-binding protein